MLEDKDRIFKNLYNDMGVDVLTSQKRGDWSRFGTAWRKSIRKRIEKTPFFLFLFYYPLHYV